MTILQAFSLDGQRAIVTGGGGGLGSVMAEALCEAGADVALVGRSASVDEVAVRLSRLGRQVHAVIADLRDPAQLRRGFDEAADRLAGVDILVTSHGAGHRAPALEETSEAWAETVRLNLSAVFELCQLAGMRMVPRGHGKIINIASMTSFTGGVGAPAYAASKGGVAQLTKALANEWAPHGVNVNRWRPGTSARRETSTSGVIPSALARSAAGYPPDDGGFPPISKGPSSSSHRPRRATSTASSCRSTVVG